MLLIMHHDVPIKLLICDIKKYYIVSDIFEYLFKCFHILKYPPVLHACMCQSSCTQMTAFLDTSKLLLHYRIVY